MVDERGEGFEGCVGLVSKLGEEGYGDDAVWSEVGGGLAVEVGGMSAVACVAAPADFRLGAVVGAEGADHGLCAEEIAEAPGAAEVDENAGGRHGGLAPSDKHGFDGLFDLAQAFLGEVLEEVDLDFLAVAGAAT